MHLIGEAKYLQKINEDYIPFRMEINKNCSEINNMLK